MTDDIAEVKGDNPNVTHVMTENEFCMIWVIFLCQQTNVMAFLCFISDSQLVEMSGQDGVGGVIIEKNISLLFFTFWAI